MTENYPHIGCNGYCEECEWNKNPRTHPVEYNFIQGSQRPIASENPAKIDIPLTDSGELSLSEF